MNTLLRSRVTEKWQSMTPTTALCPRRALGVAMPLMIKRVEEHPRYWVTNDGRVITTHKHRMRTDTRFMLPHLNRKGYSRVWLKGTCSIHRLVAKAFIPNPTNLPQINHKNFNKTDNRVENLEWCTNFYNIHHAMAGGHRSIGENRPSAKINEQQALQIISMGLRGMMPCQIQKTGEFPICREQIRQILAGLKWKHLRRELSNAGA